MHLPSECVCAPENGSLKQVSPDEDQCPWISRAEDHWRQRATAKHSQLITTWLGLAGAALGWQSWANIKPPNVLAAFGYHLAAPQARGASAGGKAT